MNIKKNRGDMETASEIMPDGLLNESSRAHRERFSKIAEKSAKQSHRELNAKNSRQAKNTDQN